LKLVIGGVRVGQKVDVGVSATGGEGDESFVMKLHPMVVTWADIDRHVNTKQIGGPRAMRKLTESTAVFYLVFNTYLRYIIRAVPILSWV